MTALLTIVAIVAGLLVLGPPLMGAEQGPDRPAVQGAAKAVAGALAWPELAGFLDAAARTESRYFVRSGASKVGTNGALGAWQIRPTSAFPTKGIRKEYTRGQALAMGFKLLDPRVNAAAIGAYLNRMKGWNPDATLGDLRASMAYPMFIEGRPTAVPEKLQAKFPTLEKFQARYDKAVENFAGDLEASGVDLSPDAPANFPPGPPPFVSRLAAQMGVPI